MAVISTLAVNLIARTSAFEKGMKTSRKSVLKFRASTTQMGMSIRRLAATISAFIGFRVLVRGFKDLISVASNAEEQIAKFTVVFGKFSDSTTKWAKAFSSSVGRSFQEVAAGLAEMQDLFVPLGFARKEATKLSKALVQLAVDVASFNERADVDVQRAFASAIVGSHRAVRSMGIAISEVRLAQFAFNAGMKKSFAQLTDIEKAYLRVLIIINDSKDAQGDATRTQDSYANQLKRTKALIIDMKKALGDQLLPVMVGVLKFTQNLIKAMSSISKESIKTAIATAKTVAKIGAFLLLIPLIVKAIKTVVLALQSMAKASAIIQGLSGPAGWASLAAGAAIAAIAVLGLDHAFGKVIDDINVLSKQTMKHKSIGKQIEITLDDVRESFEEARLNALLKQGASVFEATRTPLEKYTKRIGELREMLDITAISSDTFNRAILQAQQSAISSSGFKGAGASKTIRESLISISGLGIGTKNPMLLKLDTLIDETKKQTDSLSKIQAIVPSERELMRLDQIARDLPSPVKDLSKLVHMATFSAENIEKRRVLRLTPKEFFKELDVQAAQRGESILHKPSASVQGLSMMEQNRESMLKSQLEEQIKTNDWLQKIASEEGLR